ncbi:MAG TPA: hypothetical protein VFE32_10825 [Puia sp.]|nr:hypothetical protein [Puia sp.]
MIPFLASLTIFYQPAAEKYLRYFSFYLFVNFLFEAATAFMAFYHINNIFINNIDSLLEISFMLYLLREIIASRKAKRVFLYIFLIYPVLATVNIFLVQSSGNFHTMTYSLGTFLIVSACIYYFWELFQQKSSVDLIRQPPFWICSGLLFYYTCTYPLYGLTDFINSLPVVIKQNLYSIYIVINICLFLSFTIAFLCRLKTKRSMSM